jgi:prepilin-type N-terminal cleavage/methylation domain-containing protein
MHERVSDEAGRGRRRPGFSLIELLLVVVISLVAAGIAMPTFVRSYRSSQLRSSVRTVLMTAKYARSMSVLSQKPMALLLDKVEGELEVVALADRGSLSDRGRFLDDRSMRKEDALLGKEKEASDIQIGSELVKRLAADVRIEAFESAQAEREIEGIHWVNFYPNGMCEGFLVKLLDKDGRSAVIEMEGISGALKVEYSRL